MTYKVRVRPRDVEIEFETGSIKEAVGILQDEANAIGELFAAAPWAQTGQEQGVGTPPAAVPQKRKPRGQPDPASASAPPPLPVTAPPAPPAPPLSNSAPPAPPLSNSAQPAPPPMPPSMAPPTAPGDTTIPPFLKREAPPVVGGRLGPLVKAELDKRATDDAAKGQIVAWLVQSGVLLGTPVPTWNEATAVLTVATDKELESVAGALGIA